MSRTLVTAVLIAGAAIATAEAQNRVVNPEFDESTASWSSTWSSDDRDGCASSGSGQQAGPGFSESKCIAVSSGESLLVEYSRKHFPFSTVQLGPVLGVVCYPSTDCIGSWTSATVLGSTLESRKGWLRQRDDVVVPSGSSSCLLPLSFSAPLEPPDTIWLDGVYAGPPRLFTEDFERGAACRWDGHPAEEMTVLLRGNVPLTLVRIPAGTFLMGSPESERGRYSNETLHEVRLTQSYWLGKYEVTQAQWQAVMETAMPTECGSYGVGPDYPVYCVSWDDIAGANGFVERLNTYLGTTLFRLPTEAEWERAARAETSTRFSHGDVLECDDSCGACAVHDQFMAWCGNYSGTARPVGSKAANPFGLHDVHGNLWEWVQDWYGAYPAGAATDPTGSASGSDRVIRGGGWYINALFARSAYRSYGAPSGRGYHVGFRLARSQ